IDLERFYVASEEERASLRVRARIDGDPVIGIIARLSDVKGIDILIKAMPAVRTQFPGVQLVIMGQGKEEAALKELTVQGALEDTVRFIAEVEDMARSLNMFDLFVMPSRQEGLGLSVLEAQACGLCVVASRVGGLVSIIDEEKTGFLVEPENVAQLADMIVRVLSDDFLRRRAGQLARGHVQEHYAAATMVDKTLHVYREVIR
ncbi:MAG: glycosyltransferase family 4 protein, partial [Candidatus Omnitrophica bacterium]|nr:glycosyltransferase family 4 protein [Candidatus Omnitrophota bacterium]